MSHFSGTAAALAEGGLKDPIAPAATTPPPATTAVLFKNWRRVTLPLADIERLLSLVK
jgi:hypothetical protein